MKRILLLIITFISFNTKSMQRINSNLRKQLVQQLLKRKFSSNAKNPTKLRNYLSASLRKYLLASGTTGAPALRMYNFFNYNKTEEQEALKKQIQIQKEEIQKPDIFKTVNLNSIDDLPEYCAALANFLENQPYLPTSIEKQYFEKEIYSEESWSGVINDVKNTDYKIFEMLTNNANGYLDKSNRWNINCHDLSGILKLYIDKDKNCIPCSSEALKNSYKLILNKFKLGWKQFSRIQYLYIFHDVSGNRLFFSIKRQKDFEDIWFLFIKEQELFEENTSLMRLLASKFNLNEKISCYNYYEYDYSYGNKKPTKLISCLWVRRDAIEEVRDKLQLDI